MRVLVIYNQRSGSGGDVGFNTFLGTLGAQDAEITLRYVSPASDIAAMLADSAEYDFVVAAGGDGTASAVLYALKFSGTPVLVYPLGTANLLALNLKMPTDPVLLARSALAGCVAAVDLGEMERTLPDGSVEQVGFVNVAGAGFDAAIMESAASLKPTFGAAAYLVGAMQNLNPTLSKFVLDLDGKRIETDGIAVLVVNFGRLQLDIALTHGSDPADGLFEIAVVRSLNVAGLIPAVWSVLVDRSGQRIDRGPGLDVYHGREVTVSAEPELRMQYDGEVIDAFTPFRARVLPAAATLLVPEDSPYVTSCPPRETDFRRGAGPV